jgi:CoA:oxalate CoA-transferase
VRDRNLTVTVDHPYLGSVPVWVVPWQFGGLTPGAAQPAPLLGAHTEEVLVRLLDMPAGNVRALQRDKILY